MTTPPKLIGIEAKHITYVTDRRGRDNDALFIKEVGHFDDGSKRPRLKRIENYTRPYFITQPGRQVHQDKRDYELLSHTRQYQSTQIKLNRAVASQLNDYSGGPNPQLRRLARSPYLYGVDVNTPTLLKAEYRERHPDLFSFNQVAAGDTETNVHSQDEEIILMSVTYKRNAILLFLKSWIDGEDDLEARTRAMATTQIGDVMKEREIALEIVVCDTPGQIVKLAMERLHHWKPDFFTFWNMDFDIRKMTDALEKDGLSLADIFSDPSVPPWYRHFEYIPGKTQKITASGKSMSVAIEDRWNWVVHPAQFQIVDSMTIYRNLRLAAGKDPSYKLDYMLDKEGVGQKLKIVDLPGPGTLRWHEVMQLNHKIEYAVYNLYDSIALELLDEKTKDLASNISLQSKNSDYRHFNSQPKRLCDDMHFWHLRQDPPEVIGTSSDQAEDDNDKYVIPANDWIVTLPSYMMSPTGIKGVAEYPDYATMIFIHVSDQLRTGPLHL